MEKSRFFLSFTRPLPFVSLVADDAKEHSRILPPGRYELASMDLTVRFVDEPDPAYLPLRGRPDIALSRKEVIELIDAAGQPAADMAAWEAKLEELAPQQVAEHVADLQVRAALALLRAFNIQASSLRHGDDRRRFLGEAIALYGDLIASVTYGTPLGDLARKSLLVAWCEAGRGDLRPLRDRFCAEPEMDGAKFKELIFEFSNRDGA